eukprot:2412917-Pyramimonas_sp.AAC.1
MDYPVGDTHYGNVSSSPIDYVAAFEWQAPDVMRCCGLKRANQRLKLVRKKGLQDHIPILLNARCDFDLSGSRAE